MKLVAYILVIMGVAVSSAAHDGSRQLASCSNDVYDVSLTALDGTMALIKIYEAGEKVTSGLVQYQKEVLEDSASFLEIVGIVKAHGATPIFRGYVSDCGTWCGSNHKAEISYYDVQTDDMVDLPLLSCKGVY